MKKLLVSALALAGMASVAVAGEPVKLTSSQLDLVAAGNPCSINGSFTSFSKQVCIQKNWTDQDATAVAVFGDASAANLNATTQVQGDFNSF
jgi:hypothetical protein